MPTIEVFNTNREKVSDLELSDAVFGAEVKEQLIFATVRYQLAKRRQGTHKVKSRSEVSGGGAKPFKQKGTGRARQGTTRAPQWRGGGRVHGPTPRSYAFKLNKKVRAAALRSALSRRCGENALTVVDGITFPEIKTKLVKELMKRFELADTLVVDAKPSAELVKSARNLSEVTVLPVEGVNVLDIIRRKNLVLTQSAVDALTARLGE
jgi:large subunit ribosomal protein L4